MHPTVFAWTAALATLATLAAPVRAESRSVFVACAVPADSAPCLIQGGEPDRSRLPTTGAAAWVSDNRLVISWMGDADEVRVTGNIQSLRPMPRVAPGLYQYVIQYPNAQNMRVHLQFSVKRDGKTDMQQSIELVGPKAFEILRDGDIKDQTISFDKSMPEARVWLPPGYRPGLHYPILYLADGGSTNPGSWLTEPIRKGELAPLIVVGVDYCPKDQHGSDCRRKSYIGAVSGPQGPEFLAHERFLLDTVIPAIEAKYGSPPERRLRAIGGASNGGVWTASMALRNPGVFGTAFVMSPGVPPAQHGKARPSSRFYVSAGDLELPFRRNAQCLAGEIIARGGIATFTSYPSGHDYWMWGRIMLDNARDWLAPKVAAPVLAAPPEANCRAYG
jgi:enterochelin esterase-like enzyme